MRILPDGTVEIRNKRTGETKIVNPEELPNYGISYEKYAKERAAAAQVGIAGVGGLKTGEAVTRLRKEFNTETKGTGFKEVKKQWENMSSAGKTAAGDISIMYSYIKMLDPTTAVREGELALAAKAAGLPDRIVTAAKKLDKGGALGPEIRKQMVMEGSNIYNTAVETQQETNAFYSGLAQDSGIDPQSVVGGVGEIKKAEIPKDDIVPAPQTKEGVLGGLLLGTGKAIAQPAITSLKNIGLLGQVLGVKGLQAIGKTEAAGRLAGADILGSQERARGYSEKPGEMIKEQVGATAELLLPAILKKAGPALGAGGKVLGKVLHPRRTLGEMQAAGAVGKTGVDVKAILQAGEEYVKSDPRAARLLKTFEPAIKSTKDAPELLKRLKVWGDAFNKASEKKAGATAGLLKDLYQAGRTELERVAPEAAKARGLSALTYQVPREISKKTTQALKFTALGRLLGF